MAELPTIVQPITANATQFIAELEKAAQAANAAGQQIQQGLESATNKTANQLAMMGSRLQEIGTAMSTGITTPIVGALSVAAYTFADQEKQEKILAQLLRQTGAEAWASAEGIKALASEIQKATGYGDELILKGANILLTFRSVQNAGEGARAVFDRAVRSMADIAEVMDTSIPSAARQLGKALEDPITGLTALRRAGVSFSKEQREQIEGLVKSGHLLEAQMLILDAIEGQLGGAAAAAGQTLSGAMRGMASAIGDAFEALGEPVAIVLRPIAMMITKIAVAFTQLPLSIRVAIVSFLALIAAIGPGLVVLGKLVQLVSFLAAQSVTAIKGIGSLIQSIISGFGSLVSGIMRLAAANPYLLIVVVALMAIVGAITAVTAFISWAREHVESFAQAWDKLVAAVKAAFTAVAKIIIIAWTSAIKPIFDSFVKWLSKIAEDFARWIEEHRDTIRKWVSYIGAGFSEFVQLLIDVVWPIIKRVFGGFFHILRGIVGLVIDLIQAIWKFGEALAKAFSGNFKGAWDAAKDAIDEFWHLKDDFAQVIEGVGDTIAAPIEGIMNAQVWFSGLTDRFKANAREIGMAFDKAWDEAAKKSKEAAQDSKDDWQNAVPTSEDISKQIEQATPKAPEVKEPKAKVPEIPAPPAAPKIDMAAGNIARAADHLSDAADKQGQTAEELRRVLLSRSGIMQIIGGVVRRESEESVLAALHEISGGIRR